MVQRKKQSTSKKDNVKKKKKITSNGLIMNKIIFITSLLNDRHYSKPFIYINTFNPQNNSVLLLLSNFHPLVFHTALRFPFFFLKDSILIIRVLKFFSSSAVLLCLFLLKDGTPNLYSRYGLTFGEPSGMSPL